MKDNDFQQLVDREFAPLEWTETQRRTALSKMKKEEAPVKRKLTFALIAIIGLMIVSMTSFAVSGGSHTISDFFADLNAEREHFYFFTEDNRMNVTEGGLAAPEDQRHTSELVDVTVQQAYLTDEALYLTIHVTPKAENAVLINRASAPIYYKGEEVRYFDLYRQEDLALLDVTGFAVDYDVYGNPVMLTEDYGDMYQAPDEPGVTHLVVLTHDGDISHLTGLNAPPLVLRFCVTECHTLTHEWNALILDLPAMESIDGQDFMLQY